MIITFPNIILNVFMNYLKISFTIELILNINIIRNVYFNSVIFAIKIYQLFKR